MQFYSLIFISFFSFFSLSPMEENKEKSNCCSYFEWLLCCSSNKSSEMTPIVYSIQQNEKENKTSPKAKKRSSQEKNDASMIYFLPKGR